MTKESHYQYGDSQFWDLFEDDHPGWVNPHPQSEIESHQSAFQRIGS